MAPNVDEPVEIADYDPVYEMWFEGERRRIEELARGLSVAVEAFGRIAQGARVGVASS